MITRLKEEDMEELDIDDDDMTLLPAELPEQLLLEEEAPEQDKEELDQEIESELEMERDSLADMADADFEDEELSEEALMKLEIKGKVEQFVDDNPVEAAKLVRLMMQDEGPSAF